MYRSDQTCEGTARLLAEKNDAEKDVNVPKIAVRAFKLAKANAKFKGIDWQFTIEDWWAWWQVDQRWVHRGRGMSAMTMARRNGEGPFAPDNVVYVSHKEKLRMNPEREARAVRLRAAKLAERLRQHHPGARRIATPLGEFASAKAAAAAHGLSVSAASKYALARKPGWFYLDDKAGG